MNLLHNSRLPLLSSPCQAEVRLPAAFGEHRVLQQKRSVPVWGGAKPGETVRVSGSGSDETVSIAADVADIWRVQLPTPQAGGPFTVKIAGTNEIIVKDVQFENYEQRRQGQGHDAANQRNVREFGTTSKNWSSTGTCICAKE